MVIRDYKFDTRLTDGKRGRKGKGRLIILAIAVLGGTLLALKFLPGESSAPAPKTVDAAAPAFEVSSLALPGKPAGNTGISKLKLPGKTLLTVPEEHKSASPDNQVIIKPLPGSPPSSILQPRQGSQSAALQKPVASKAAPLVRKPEWKTHKIVSGESLSRIFKDQSLAPSLLHKVINSSKQAKQLANIRPGQTLRFILDSEENLEQLVLVKSPVESLHIRARGNTFETELVSKAIEKRPASTAGTIQSSLFADGLKAGLTDGQVIELAALFGWDIDFALEIRAGDQFRVLYEEQYLDGEKYRNGPILAAEFTNRGKTYQAVRFESSNGDVNYYDSQGRNKRRAFIRTPIKFARISSHFNPKRLHPVLKKKRPHKGVDYAAPIGTPIKATGAGKIIFRGWKGGYGRVVIVQHGRKYQTLYAHMSKFSSKAKAGRKVKQGQTVGYVGKSGRVTGAHLHYEFRVNGVHRNPVTVKLPKSLPLPKKQLAAFKEQTTPLLTQLASIKPATMVASN